MSRKVGFRRMKKNLLSILILVLLVVNIALTAVMMISVTGTNKKTADLITSIATVMNLELYEPGGDPVARFTLQDDEEVRSAYEYCNLHGLWKSARQG